MYLSRIELDTSRRSTMKALDMPNLMHGAVESSFAGERARNLWRIDPLQGKLYLLLLSPAKPDLQGLAQQFGVPGQSGKRGITARCSGASGRAAYGAFG